MLGQLETAYGQEEEGIRGALDQMKLAYAQQKQGMRGTFAQMKLAYAQQKQGMRGTLADMKLAYAQQKEGLESELGRLTAAPVVDPSIRKAHTEALESQLLEGEKRTELGAARRGFYSSTIPGAISGVQRRKGMLCLLYTSPSPRD